MTGKLTQTAQFAGLAVSRPIEFYDRLHGRRERSRGRRDRARNGRPPKLDAMTADPVDVAHHLLGASDGACCREDLARARDQILARLGSQQHYNDGGTALAEGLWVIVRHAKPRKVIETGVARGVSSAFMLDAMRLNDLGHLWSIDMPPILPGWDQTGIAVAPEDRHRWTYLRGASRRLLPPLLKDEAPIDLFVHDSLHTLQNMLFEMRAVWDRMAPDGFLVSDDAGQNIAVPTFAKEIGVEPTLVKEEKKDGVVAIFRRAS